MNLRTLGGLSLEGASFHRRKPLLLLAYLALQGPTERRYLAELFWSNAADARHSLATALSQLRSGAPGAVRTDEARVWTEVECDVTSLLQADEARDHLRVLELYRDPFLQGVDIDDGNVELEEWLYGAREALASKARNALLGLAERAAGEGRIEEAGRLAERAFRLPATAPLEPEGARRLYTLLLATDSPAAGPVREEARELGVPLPPSAEAARHALRARASSRAGTALPSRTTAFVGREAERAEIARLLAQPETRLLSLVGPGGVGKTRLGLQVAAEQAQGGSWNGIHFVPLEALSDPGLVVPAIGAALGLEPLPQADLVAQLAQVVGTSSRLVVLDNFEHVLGAAPLLSDLVRACPNLRLIATSRERLGLEEEAALLLEGLDVPAHAPATLDEALRFDAVALFVQRARRARRDVVLAGTQLPFVLRICSAVGGLPLALEMAAGWVRVMTCQEIAEELERGLDLLEHRDRDLAERHRSIRSTFDATWRRLTPAQKRMLRRISIFRGGFTREAAREVAGASLGRLASLVDLSLISWNGTGRYALHPLLQQYLAEKARLVPLERENAEERRSRYFLGLLGDLARAFPHQQSGPAARTIELDLKNIVAGWCWAADRDRGELLEGAVHPLGWFLRYRGQAERTLALVRLVRDSDRDSLLGLRRRFWEGASLMELGSAAEGRARLQEAVALAEHLEAREDLALALRMYGIACTRLDPPDESAAEVAHRRALDLYREQGNVEGVAMMLNNLAYREPSSDRVVEVLREGLELARNAAETHALAVLSGTLGEFLLWRAGRYAPALEALAESAASHQETGSIVQLADALVVGGEAHLALGQVEAAALQAERASELSESFNVGAAAMTRSQARALLGHVHRLAGEAEAARARYDESLRLAGELAGHEITAWAAAMARCGLARIALSEGRAAEAAAHARAGLERVERHSARSAFEFGAAQLACMVRLGEALAHLRERRAAVVHLRRALGLARAWGHLPAALDALFAIGSLRRLQGREGEVRELLAAVADHPSSPFELAEAARTALGARPREAPFRAAGAGPRLDALVARTLGSLGRRTTRP